MGQTLGEGARLLGGVDHDEAILGRVHQVQGVEEGQLGLGRAVNAHQPLAAWQGRAVTGSASSTPINLSTPSTSSRSRLVTRGEEVVRDLAALEVRRPQLGVRGIAGGCSRCCRVHVHHQSSASFCGGTWE